MCLKLAATDRKRHVAELFIVKQIAQVLRKLTFWHFKLYYVALSWYIHTICHHTDLQRRQRSDGWKKRKLFSKSDFFMFQLLWNRGFGGLSGDCVTIQISYLAEIKLLHARRIWSKAPATSHFYLSCSPGDDATDQFRPSSKKWKRKSKREGKKKIVTKSASLTSQKMVNLSSGKRPLASSRRKSRRMNFLKPQSLPCTKRYARCDSIAFVSSRLAFRIENLNLARTSDLLHDTRSR